MIVAVAIGAGAIAACDHANPNPLTPQPTPALSTGTQQTGYELTGVVTGDDGRVLAGAKVWVDFQPVGGGHFIGTMTTADSAGRYDVAFDGVRGGYLEGTTALVHTSADGYEDDNRWFIPTSSARLQTVDLHPRVIRQINAGESAAVTVTPDDTPCINDIQDFPGLGPDYVCRTIRILASTGGALTIEATPAQNGQTKPQLEAQVVNGPGEDLGNPIVLNVTAGQVVMANVELLTGLPAQAFELKTSIASPGRAVR